MKERPILMSAPMVRATLDGSKTQTRRIVKAPEIETANWVHNANMGGPGGGRWWDLGWDGTQRGNRFRCPYGVPSDRLWIKETYRFPVYFDDRKPTDCRGQATWYEADPTDLMGPLWGRLRPSIHMPRGCSRINLEITDVRVERLQEISEADALAEGLEVFNFTGWGDEPGVPHMPEPDVYRGFPEAEWEEHAPTAYRTLWEHINGPGSWDANPYVWALTFKRVR